MKPLEIVFENNLFINAYATLFMGTEKWMRDEGNSISREGFSGGYVLYALDLTSDLSEGGGHFNLIRHGNIRVDMKFARALENTINVIASQSLKIFWKSIVQETSFSTTRINNERLRKRIPVDERCKVQSDVYLCLCMRSSTYTNKCRRWSCANDLQH